MYKCLRVMYLTMRVDQLPLTALAVGSVAFAEESANLVAYFGRVGKADPVAAALAQRFVQDDPELLSFSIDGEKLNAGRIVDRRRLHAGEASVFRLLPHRLRHVRSGDDVQPAQRRVQDVHVSGVDADDVDRYASDGVDEHVTAQTRITFQDGQQDDVIMEWFDTWC